ncbi:MAG: HIT family protein [Gammaproteobacteria bacterium]|nr:HIT family protein [Gammaproteobacteria bacterium]
MSTAFALHPRLAADCAVVGDLEVCRLLAMNDARFPWCILVPRRSGLTELHQLDGADRPALFAEIDAVSQALLAEPGIRKINIGALGNMVEQLHIHVVGRRPDDAAWPGPVWGSGSAEPYPPAQLQTLTHRLQALVPIKSPDA